METSSRSRERRVTNESDVSIDDDAWDQIYPVLKEFATSLDVNIHVSSHDGNQSAPRGGNRNLYIRFFSLPEQPYTTDVSRLFGIELRWDQTEMLFPVDGGKDIVDPDGVTVAQVFDSTLYVLFDLPSYAANAADLMQRIMEGYVDLINGKKPFEVVPESSVSNMTTLFQRSLDVQMNNLRERHEQARKKMAWYERALAELAQQTALMEQELKTAKVTAKETIPSAVDQALAALSEMSSDGLVTVTDRFIKVNIGQIDIIYEEFDGWEERVERHVYDIGEFDVYIYPDGSYGYVRCVNRTRIVGTDERCYHPHVLSNGDCCLGNIKEIIKKLVLDGDFEMTVQMIRIFLSKLGEDAGVYADVSEWPEKRK